jgi:thioredoxin 1
MCLPVYAVMEDLCGKYPHVAFYDQDFDGPAAGYIRALPECRRFMGLPFTVYFKNGKVAAATASIQTATQVREHLDREFGSVK